MTSFLKKNLTLFDTFSSKVAVIYKKEELYYHELLYRIRQVGTFLNRYKNKHIIYLGGKSIDLISISYGILLSGNIYIPLNRKDSEIRVLSIIDSIKNPIVIIDRDDDISRKISNTIIFTDELFNEVPIKIDRFISSEEKDVAYTIFTSGSTGSPKGAIITYQALSELLLWYTSYLKLTEETVSGLIAPTHFDLSIPDIFALLIYCGVLHIIPDEIILFPKSFVTYIEHGLINHLAMVPSFFSRIEPHICGTKSSLKDLVLIGEVFPRNSALSLLKKHKNLSIYNMYGPTEACFCVSSFKFTLDCPYINTPIGNPRNMNLFKIVDDELIIGGNCVSLGYLNSSNDCFYTEDSIRWYKTGDIVSFKDGNYFFIGRRDRQIKLNGYRIELEEIETVLSHVLNTEVIIIFEKKLVGFIKNSGRDNLINYAKEKQKKLLPQYMRVSSFVLIETFPITSSGKIDYNKLLKMKEYN
ncbi:hypothetical protein EW093_07150 [Thiospirochaeta perfilievii]|uniref:AMP-dependent synthetase/ligase domain-containing protein n=1 Tax=Thiospirochaeta perfilievii TaxID=252967 RepID=A0A5C1Q8U4_9SPIO|nr:AMP-binding protein [Thiospirochaeta perfilievii]QEN04485.1 hypothetical protein EW093_07150 [Thiospirochaeta perfilievii]